jgi:taurine dioxygenase
MDNKDTKKEFIMKKKTGCFGVELYNFDIKDPLCTKLLPSLLDEYLVIIIKGSYLTYEEQNELSLLFGKSTLAHPVVPGNSQFTNILEVDSTKGGKNAKWHTDVTFLEKPHAVTILIGDEIPEAGGDTVWCDLRTSYNKMNDGIKFFLNTLEAAHKITPLAYWGEPFNYLSDNSDNIIKLYENSKKFIPIIHPVVRIHPRSNKPSFFVNPGYTSHILNLSRIESDNILNLIYEHTTQLEFTLRHQWEKNDIVIWDNMCTAHYAINDYENNIRKMRRVTVEGDIPFGFNNLKSRFTNDLLSIIR